MVFKATFFNFKHERVISFDNIPNSENSLTCKLNIDTEGNVAGTELIFEITSKMSKEEKEMTIKAKKMYAIKKETVETEVEKAERAAAVDEFNKLRAKSS